MKKLLTIIFIFSCFGASAQTSEVMYLTGKGLDDATQWDFMCDKGSNSGKWTKIQVPSCWEQQGFGSYNYGHDKNQADETGFYKTTFTVPASWKNKRIFIVFEGSMTDTEVKVNGKKAGEVHQGAFYRFKREITPYVQQGTPNVLEVKVSKKSANQSVNEAERGADFWIFGGIYRPVYLEAVPDKFIEYTAIDARHTGDIKAEAILSAPMKDVSLEMIIRDEKGQTVKTISSHNVASESGKLTVSGSVPGIKPWSDETPVLYTALIMLKIKGQVIHTLTDRIGFRTIEVRDRDGIYVNGKKLLLKGVNRHSFWPETGRTTNRALSITDAAIIKDMNMNAVRMSHYPPDKHFLEICDSIGLYVIDELCAWQYPPYDTPVGSILTRELVIRDVNHPCVILWANGNEGGFNPDFDPLFPLYDIQQRRVIHPWAFSGGINTTHYIDYDTGIQSMFHGRDVFIPTEILHGLYDGGHGAGLDDYWNLMLANPVSGGMFLWDFSDQAIKRTDKNGLLDTDKDHGPDGIVGPYREKEGSYFSIKEIWSPIHLHKRYLTPQWDGAVTVDNRYTFTNTKACGFSYMLATFPSLDASPNASKSAAKTGRITSPDIAPGRNGELTIDLPGEWKEYDVLYIKATDPSGRELYTWSYDISTPETVAKRMLPKSGVQPAAEESADVWTLVCGEKRIEINKADGLLRRVTTSAGEIPFTNGPVLITNRTYNCKSVEYNNIDGIPTLSITYEQEGNARNRYKFKWKMLRGGVLELDYEYRPQDLAKMAGITFSFPEKNIKGATLMANGPYRIYNNRMKGGTLNVWDKKYNNTVTGESWVYPEFKGYYSQFYAVRVDCDTPFEIYSGSEDKILHLFTPEAQSQFAGENNNTVVPYPSGNISVMDVVPAVGTKFGKAENYGPQSNPRRYKTNDAGVTGVIYFNF